MNKNKLLNLLLAGSMTFSIPVFTLTSVYATDNGIDTVSSSTQTPTEKKVVATYQVPAQLISKAPLAPIQNAFANAFGGMVTIEEYSDGTMQVTANCNHMVIEELFGGTYEANIKTLAYYDSEGNTHDVDVLSTRQSQYSAQFGAPDQFVDIEVPDKISFPLTANADGNYVLSATIDFMDAFMGQGNPYPTDITLQLDMENKVELGDRESLKAKIEVAQSYLSGDYTASSKEQLQAKIDAALAVLDLETITKEQSDAAIQDLNTAIDALEENAKELADGEYNVEAAFYKEGSVTETSMANNALESASIKVVNGKITAVLNVKPMTMMGITANIDKLEYQDTDGNWHEAAISQMDEANNPTQFSFELPENVSYTAVRFYYMGSDRPAQVTLYLNLSDVVAVKAEKYLLQTKLDEAKAIDSQLYTGATYEVLQNAIANAESVNQNDNATQAQVDEQVILLQNAIDQLVLRPTGGKELLNEDGVYQVPVNLWHATQDQASMAAASLGENAKIEVKDGVKMMTIYTKEMQFGNITASLQELKVLYPNGEYKTIEPATRDENGNPTSFTFELPNEDEYIIVKVNPHVALMGNMDIDARIKVDYDHLTVLDDDSSIDDTTSNTNTSSSTTTSLPQTGDKTMAPLYLGLAAASISMAYVVGKKKED